MNKVLIVDDDPAVTKLLAALLAEEGFDPVTATSGQAALDMLRTDTPDVVLLDLMMPLVSGSMVCSQLKTDSATKHIPVIVISGDGRAERKVRDIGADDFVLKPFDLDDVIKRVRRWCGEKVPGSSDVPVFQGDGISERA